MIKIVVLFLLLMIFSQCEKDDIFKPGYPIIPDVEYYIPDEYDTLNVTMGNIESTNLKVLGFSLKYHIIPYGFELVCINNNPFVSSIAIIDSVSNCKSDKKMPYSAILDAKKAFLICTYTTIDTSKPPQFNSAIFGNIDGIIGSKHNDEYIYTLPYANGESYVIGQGYNSSFTHKGNNGGYCLDFLMPVGTRIYAAREGIVCRIEEKHDTCGIGEYFETLNNYILILHNDLTTGVYSHIRYDGASVKKGDYVKKGQFIGYSGMVGYTNIPHLHFEVEVPISPLPREKIAVPTLFDTKEDNKIYLEEGHGYTSTSQPND